MNVERRSGIGNQHDTVVIHDRLHAGVVVDATVGQMGRFVALAM